MQNTLGLVLVDCGLMSKFCTRSDGRSTTASSLSYGNAAVAGYRRVVAVSWPLRPCFSHTAGDNARLFEIGLKNKKEISIGGPKIL